jgi:hypothetical protein
MMSAGVAGPMQEITELNDPNADETAPTVTPDDLTMYFSRTDNVSRHHMYVTRRSKTTDPWGSPQLISELDVNNAEQEPGYITADGCILYFTREKFYDDGGEIFFAVRGP